MKGAKGWGRLAAAVAGGIYFAGSLGVLGWLLGSAPRWLPAPGIGPAVRGCLNDLVINDVTGWTFAILFCVLWLRQIQKRWREDGSRDLSGRVAGGRPE